MLIFFLITGKNKIPRFRNIPRKNCPDRIDRRLFIDVMKSPSEEDMTFGRICRHCGIKKSDINIAKIARESQSRLSKAMEKHLLCFDCRTDIIQSEKLKERNKSMNNVINELAVLPKIE